ncbi:MAG: glutamine--scyllo-inositol aminotransferase, partial [Chloroflexi bacterium]|nr:glutamine--scyllo-inositol aminotransferase [Chloroflexota bacterium]
DKGWPREGGIRQHAFLAPNYHMTEMQAAVGIAQLRKLPAMVQARRERAQELTRLLSDLPGLTLPPDGPEAHHTYWQYPLRVDLSRFGASLAQMGQAIHAEGIPVNVGYLDMPMYQYETLTQVSGRGGRALPQRYGPGLCPQAEEVLASLYVIPWNERYTLQMVADMAAGLRKVFCHYSLS